MATTNSSSNDNSTEDKVSGTPVAKISGVLIKTDMEMNIVNITEKDIPLIISGKPKAPYKGKRLNHLDGNENFLYHSEKFNNGNINFIASILAMQPIRGNVIFSNGTELTEKKTFDIFFKVQELVKTDMKKANGLRVNRDFMDIAEEALGKAHSMYGKFASANTPTPTPETNVEKAPEPPRISYTENNIHYITGHKYVEVK